MKEKLKNIIGNKSPALHEYENTNELVMSIERKDRRFRFFQSCFMIGTFIFLILIIGSQQQTINGINNQITEARAERTKQNTANQKRTETILRRLDCLAAYFSLSNRAGLTIQDINACTINRDGTPQALLSPQNNGDNSNLTPSAQGTAPTQNAPVANAPSNSTPQPPVNDGIQTEQRPPGSSVQLNLPFVPPVEVNLCLPLVCR